MKSMALGARSSQNLSTWCPVLIVLVPEENVYNSTASKWAWQGLGPDKRFSGKSSMYPG